MKQIEVEGSEYDQSPESEDDHNDSKLFNLLSLSKRGNTFVSASVQEEKYQHLMQGLASDCEDTPEKHF